MKNENNLAIKLVGVDVCFYVQENGYISLKQLVLNFGKHKFLQKKFVLKNINLEIKKGESVALFGKNGSGKSTLLRVMSQIIEAEKGNVLINGKVSPLLGLGVGLEYELTGIENISLVCALMGISNKEVKSLIPEIIEFSELGDDINLQVKRYSTGMMTRLAFSIAIIKQPDILLIDEVLAVGDAGFQIKCLKKIEEIKKNGATIIFVSHSLQEAKTICSKGILVNNGTIEFIGDIDEVGKLYSELF
jgi:ABC-type polysaccharide/polyol phosphate transport system ATPase subunit